MNDFSYKAVNTGYRYNNSDEVFVSSMKYYFKTLDALVQYTYDVSKLSSLVFKRHKWNIMIITDKNIYVNGGIALHNVELFLPVESMSFSFKLKKNKLEMKSLDALRVFNRTLNVSEIDALVKELEK